MLQNKGCNPTDKSHLAKHTINLGVSECHGKIERLRCVSGIPGNGLTDAQVSACNRPLAIQGGIRIQNRSVCIRKRTLFIRVPAVKDIALIGVLLYLRRIGRSVTDIVVRRGCYIGRVICTNPFIMNTNACNRPLAIQGGIRIQNRTVCIRKRTLFIRVPAVKDIALIGVLLYLRRIGRSVTDIVVRRGGLHR